MQEATDQGPWRYESTKGNPGSMFNLKLIRFKPEVLFPSCIYKKRFVFSTMNPSKLRFISSSYIWGLMGWNLTCFKTIHFGRMEDNRQVRALGKYWPSILGHVNPPWTKKMWIISIRKHQNDMGLPENKGYPPNNDVHREKWWESVGIRMVPLDCSDFGSCSPGISSSFYLPWCSFQIAMCFKGCYRPTCAHFRPIFPKWRKKTHRPEIFQKPRGQVFPVHAFRGQ